MITVEQAHRILARRPRDRTTRDPLPLARCPFLWKPIHGTPVVEVDAMSESGQSESGQRRSWIPKRAPEPRVFRSYLRFPSLVEFGSTVRSAAGAVRAPGRSTRHFRRSLRRLRDIGVR